MTTIIHPDYTERLWTTPDGTTCILATCDDPPMYSVTLVRDTKVLRHRRLYGRASAEIIAVGWQSGGGQ